MKKSTIVIITILVILIIVFVTLFCIKRNNKVSGNDETKNVVENTTKGTFNSRSVEEWESLALDFYEKENDYRPSLVESIIGDDGNLVIQLYDNLGDHNSTSEFYFVDKESGIATNLLGDKVDLVNGKYV